MKVVSYVYIISIVLILQGCLSTSECKSVPDQTVFLEKEVKITDSALFFDGKKMGNVHRSLETENNRDGGYNYQYGSAISPHGDAIKTYKHYVFMTWYKGGKYNRHMMLSRLNLKNGQLRHIDFLTGTQALLVDGGSVKHTTPLLLE